MDEFVRALPDHSAEVTLAVDSLDLVRVVTLADPGLTVDHLMVTVSEWERPCPHWTGRLGQVKNVSAYLAQYPEHTKGHARADIQLSKPTPLSEVARAIYPLFGVDRRQHGYGYAELGTADLPVRGLALLPSRTAMGVPGLPIRDLDGIGLSRADIGLVGSDRTRDEPSSVAGDHEEPLFSQLLRVDPCGHLTVNERFEAPLVDLNVHHPIGRLPTFVHPPGTMALTLEDGTLTMTATNTGEEEAAEDLVGWSRPARLPISGAEVRALRDAEAIDLSALRVGGRDDELQLHRRLAELAATGAILHSLPPSFTMADDVLGATLADLFRAPWVSSHGLVRELRSVPQRREAMSRFGGFFELAEHTQKLGHRLLPTVSVVLSSMRPARVTAVLTALAAQTYPHVEIALALHGVDEPLSPEFTEAVRASGAAVRTHDRSTPFGSVLADTARHTTGDLVVKVDDDDVYGPRVIEDLVLAYLYSNADVVGKATEYLYFENLDHTAHRKFMTERYHYQVAGGAMLLSRGVLNDIGGWRPSTNSTDRSILIRVGNSGGVGYRTQSLGYIYVRHSDGHTWKQEDSMLLRNSPIGQWPRFMREIVEA